MRGDGGCGQGCTALEGMRQKTGLSALLQKDPNPARQGECSCMGAHGRTAGSKGVDGPSISKTSFWGPGQHAAQQRCASPALMFTEGLLWLCVPPPAQTQQQVSGGPAE